MKTLLITVLSLIVSVAVTLAGNTTVTNTAAHPVPVTQVVSATAGGTPLTQTFYSGHITTSATTVVNATTSYVQTLVIAVTNAGTGWTITVRSKEATPTVLYSGTAALGTITPISVQSPGVISGSGIDIITAGTAGVADVKVTYWK
jgi:hypothetical protein